MGGGQNQGDYIEVVSLSPSPRYLGGPEDYVGVALRYTPTTPSARRFKVDFYLSIHATAVDGQAIAWPTFLTAK